MEIKPDEIFKARNPQSLTDKLHFIFAAIFSLQCDVVAENFFWGSTIVLELYSGAEFFEFNKSRTPRKRLEFNKVKDKKHS